MKKNFKGYGLVIFSVLVFVFIVKTLSDNVFEGQNNAVSVMEWKKSVEKVRGPIQVQANSRSVASIQDPPSSKMKNGRVLPSWKVRKDIDSKVKLGQDRSYKFDSTNPSQRSDFISGVSKYKFLDNLYAIKNNNDNRSRFPDAEIKLGYLIVHSDTAIADSLAVVENAQTGHLGIFTGIIKAKLKSMNDVDFIISHGRYEVVNTYEHINLVQYRIDDIVLAVKTNKSLQGDPRIIRASLEILEYARANR